MHSNFSVNFYVLKKFFNRTEILLLFCGNLKEVISGQISWFCTRVLTLISVTADF